MLMCNVYDINKPPFRLFIYLFNCKLQLSNNVIILAALQICDVVRQGADVFWIEEQQAPFAVLGDQWVSFDDDNSLINKVLTCLSFTEHLLADQRELVDDQLYITYHKIYSSMNKP